jgi:hypothetical protein
MRLPGLNNPIAQSRSHGLRRFGIERRLASHPANSVGSK